GSGVGGGAGAEILAPAGTDQHRIAALQLDALATCRLGEHLASNADSIGERRTVAIYEPRYVEQHAAVDQKVFRIVRDIQVRADAAAADAAQIARRCGGIDAAEQ